METFLEKARWWTREDNLVRCLLCPHECRIKDGKVGICGVRENISMELYSLNYGRVCVAAVDNIEKKPIYHYRPGSTLYSIGTFGCNLDCSNCQNYELALGDVKKIPFSVMTPEDLISEALSKEVDGIGWTFNEPVVWLEYVLDTSIEARKRGLYSMVNTNGFIAKVARDELLHNIDVMKIDVKGFSDEFYKRICNGRLQPVLDTCISAKEAGVHVEIAYLLIPDLNDSEEEIRSFTKWVSESMGPNTPLHLFRFSPAYRLSHLQQESIERMRIARRVAMESGLKYVYFGGLVSAEEQNTYCPRCGELLVSRRGEEPLEKIYVKKAVMSQFCPDFSDITVNLRDGRCPGCGELIEIRFV